MDKIDALLDQILKISNQSSEARGLAVETYQTVKEALSDDAEGAMRSVVEDLVRLMSEDGLYDNFAAQCAPTGLHKSVAELNFDHEVAGPCSLEFAIDLSGGEDEKRNVLIMMYVDRELVASRSILSDLGSAAESLLPEIERGLSNRSIP